MSLPRVRRQFVLILLLVPVVHSAASDLATGPGDSPASAVWLTNRYAAQQIGVVASECQPPDDEWRYTNRGWERLGDIQRTIDASHLPPITGVHPLLVCGLEVLLCIGAFCLFPSGPSAERGSPQ